MSRHLIECDIGDVVVVRATLKDEQGNAVEGATVTARTLHRGTETDLGTATDEGGGEYSVEVEPTAFGVWDVRVEADDPTQAAEEGRITARRTRFET